MYLIYLSFLLFIHRHPYGPSVVLTLKIWGGGNKFFHFFFKDIVKKQFAGKRFVSQNIAKVVEVIPGIREDLKYLNEQLLKVTRKVHKSTCNDRLFAGKK